MILKTGYGYFVTADGRKVHKFEFPVGQHPDNNRGYSVVEVADKEALNAIMLDKTDEQIAKDKEWQERKVLRASARTKLKSLLTEDELGALFGRV